MAETNKLQKVITKLSPAYPSPPEVTGFAIELGKDPENKLLHFNPRFYQAGPKIILNDMVNSSWSKQQNESSPLRNDEDFKVRIKFNGDNFEIDVSDKHTMMFPKRSSTYILDGFWIGGMFS
ncbi:beta-galactoside-binding lectin-like [Rhinoraja longicauda]